MEKFLREAQLTQRNTEEEQKNETALLFSAHDIQAMAKSLAMSDTNHKMVEPRSPYHVKIGHEQSGSQTKTLRSPNHPKKASPTTMIRNSRVPSWFTEADQVEPEPDPV